MIESPVWTYGPSGSGGVMESLGWLTDVMRSRNGAQQKRQLRERPRRYFEYDMTLSRANRTTVDMFINALGITQCVLPVWHDVQVIDAVAAGATEIPCATAGYELVAGGIAVLIGKGAQVAVEVLAVDDGLLTLAEPLAAAWPAGTKLYPGCLATLSDASQETGLTGRIGVRTVRFAIQGDIDWPAAWDAYYLGAPVLTRCPVIGSGVDSEIKRDIVEVDEEVGPVVRYDYPGRAFRSVGMEFVVKGRAQAASVRSLIYGLRGRAENIWVPTWNRDLQASGSASGAALRIKAVGYAYYGLNNPALQHIRITRESGAATYHRITAAVGEAGGTELLTISPALPAPLAESDIRSICFVVLSESASDTFEIVHPQTADGITRAAVKFQAIKHELT